MHVLMWLGGLLIVLWLVIGVFKIVAAGVDTARGKNTYYNPPPPRDRE